ncbi:MAG: helix-turn-helix domain-containing protein [Chloroflexi bacterium]|nr:MAG: helix-turn-helix domain-containing protein [Chloroflexota bacterium]
MTSPRLPSNSAPASPERRGRGAGKPAAHPVSPPGDPSTERSLGTALLIDSREVARLLGIGRTKAFELMARQELPVVRIGRCRRVSRKALEEWVAQSVSRSNDSEPAEASSFVYAQRRL